MIVYGFPFGGAERNRQSEAALKSLLKSKGIDFIRLFIQSYSMVLIEVKDIEVALTLVKAIQPHRVNITVSICRDSVTLTTMESGYRDFQITL